MTTWSRAARPRRLLAVILLAVLAGAAGWGLWRSVETAPAPSRDRVAHLAASLRCPACAGQSVAESQSPVAAAMRQAVADQVSAGRSDGEIRAWFVQRYGQDVLLDPSGHGLGLLLWVLPAVVLVGGAGLVVVLRRRSTTGRTAGPGRGDDALARRSGRVWASSAAGVLAMVSLVALAAVWTTGGSSGTAAAGPRTSEAAASSTPGVQDPMAVGRGLEDRGQFAAAAAVYQEALRAAPDDTVLHLRLGFALLRAGQPAAAEGPVREVLTASADQPDALLVLGLAQRALKDPAATATLRRFLRVAPDHQAATAVRELLARG